MLQIENGAVTITRIGPNHETIAALSAARANLQGTSMGAPVAPPWYQPGMDSEIGGAQFADWLLMIGGPDENPDYEPRPGDVIVFTPLNPASKRAGVYRQVAANTGEEGFGLDSWELPCCKSRSHV